MSQSDDILFSVLPGKHGHIGEICLNRPKALNALTRVMCELLCRQLQAWEEDNTIKAVIIRGEGGRAFCAGGDVRALYHHRDTPEVAMEFFRQEYQMNKVIFHFKKPYIALLDGITMGGGAGVSLHGSHRVASEFFTFAMPETAIGFFPDIGAGYFLNRCPDHFGEYLGLTGETITISEALPLGLVNHAVAREKIPQCVAELCAADLTKNSKTIVTQIISAYDFVVAPSELLAKKQDVAHIFSAKQVVDIMDRLKTCQDAWAVKALSVLQKRSPTSLAVTLEHLHRSKSLDFDAVMQRDFHLAQAFMHTPDFFEGVRAVLVDKDQKPTWQPKTISNITAETLAPFFSFPSPIS